jgi:predicted  nucleic acid-binding Zn-ribbon protein
MSILELADEYAQLEGKLASLEEIWTHSRTYAKELRKEITESRAALTAAVERNEALLRQALEAMQKAIPRLSPYGEQDWLDCKAAIQSIKQHLGEA